MVGLVGCKEEERTGERRWLLRRELFAPGVGLEGPYLHADVCRYVVEGCVTPGFRRVFGTC